MKIIFYRNAETGKIFNAHFSDPSWDDEELQRRIDETNAKSTHAHVYAVEADENMEYLMKKTTERRIYNSNQINEILETLREVESAVESLTPASEY